jgi:tetratricopeptide (TPR) repeat protein
MRFQLANVCQLQGHYAEARRRYEATLELSPNAAVVYNELALLEALDGHDGKAALRLVNHAIEELAGPLPYLLDTRATIYLTLGDTGRALDDLSEAADDGPTPTQYFHMARAHMLSGEMQAARSTYQTGLALGLHAKSLHPLERKAFAKLEARMR